MSDMRTYQRASQACAICRKRKSRCDALTRGLPCSYCANVGLQCILIEPRRNRSTEKVNPTEIARSERRDKNGIGVRYPPESEESLYHKVNPILEYRKQSPVQTGIQANKGPVNSLPPASVRATPLRDEQEDRIIYTSRSLGIDKILPAMSGHMRVMSSKGPVGQVSHWKKRVKKDYENSRVDLSAWTDLACAKWTSQAFDKLPYEDIDFLVNQKGAFLFPPLHILKCFILTFFKFVYPSFPVLDRGSFRSDFVSQGLSPLLLHSMLFAASFYVDDETVKAAGFAGRHSARSYFFQRAKVLYSLDFERRQVPIIQSLILLSVWRDAHDEEKQSRHWLNTAMTLATQMGMHRSLRETSILSESEKRLWRRIWWSLYARERHTGPAMGCPISLSAEDIDIEDLTEEDFSESETQRRMQIDVSGVALEWGDADIEIDAPSQLEICHCVQWVKLAKIYDKIIRQQYCATDKLKNHPGEISVISEDLRRWKAQVPDNLRVDSSYNEGWNIRTYYPLLLHLAYERAIALHYRPLCLQSGSTEVCSPSEARTFIFNSAVETLRIIELLLQNDLLLYCPPHTMTALFTAMATLIEEIRQTGRDSTRHYFGKAKVGLGVIAFRELLKAQMAGSHWALNLFEGIVERDFMLDYDNDINLQNRQSAGSALISLKESGSTNIAPEYEAYFEEAARSLNDEQYEHAFNTSILQDFDATGDDVLNFLSMV